MKSTIRVIVDHIGRTVVGEEVSSTSEHLTLNNPVIIHVQPNPQTGQLQVQSFPYLFMEFIKPASRDKNQWTFNLSQIVVSDVELDDAIVAQYKGVNSPQPAQPQGDAEVIRLFED
jgi:hypothetical protein